MRINENKVRLIHFVIINLSRSINAIATLWWWFFVRWAGRENKIHFSRRFEHEYSRGILCNSLHLFWPLSISSVRCMEYGLRYDVTNFYRWKFKEMFEGRIHSETENTKRKTETIQILSSLICASMNEKTKKVQITCSVRTWNCWNLLLSFQINIQYFLPIILGSIF